MDFAADVVAVLPQLGHQRVALLGFSLGGLASLYLTAHHPELCAALMLVDVAPRLETDGVRRIRDFMTRHESFGSLDEVVEALREYNPNRPPDSIRAESLMRNLRQRPDGRYEWHYDKYFRTPITEAGRRVPLAHHGPDARGAGRGRRARSAARPWWCAAR